MKKRYGCLLLFVLMLTFLIGCIAPAVDKDDVSDTGNKPAVSDLGNTSDTETTTVDVPNDGLIWVLELLKIGRAHV